MDSGQFSQTGSPRPSGDPVWTSRRLRRDLAHAPATAWSRWALPHPTLVWAIAAAWAVAVAAQATGRGRLLHHDTLAGGDLPSWAAFGLCIPVLEAEGPLPAGVPASDRLPAAALPARPGCGLPPGRPPWALLRRLLLALMLVAFAAGVANLWWMAVLTAVMVFEKTGRGGRRGVRPIGLGLIALGVLVLAGPAAG